MVVKSPADSVISVRPMREADLDIADRIMRLAFGTFAGLADPMSFLGDAGLVRSRWRADPSAAFVAEIDNQVVASNFAANWGSVGFFGPLTVHPDLWDRGIGRRLMDAVMERFSTWETRHTGLFTFAQSQKHVAMYQKFGFWPRFLTAVMSISVGQKAPPPVWSRYSDSPDGDQPALLERCCELTDTVYDGLDLRREIVAVRGQGLGDTVLLWDDDVLSGLAICHYGAGTEGGSGACFVKFGAVRPGLGASERFERLLDACDSLAANEGVKILIAGVNMGRHEAYRQMIDRGFRTDLQGVAMQRGNDAGYNRPGVFLVDDWR